MNLPSRFVFLSRSALYGLVAALLVGIIVPALLAAVSAPAGSLPVLALLGQCLLVTGLAVFWFQRRIAAPLRALEQLADDLASGNPGLPLDWQRGDEPGRLAASLKRACQSMQRTLTAERDAFEQLPVGVVFVRNRVIESCNRRAESLFGYPPGRLAGCGTEVIYPQRDDFLDTGERAYAVIERGETFAATLSLRRRDGSRFEAALGGRAVNAERPHDGSVWAIMALPPKSPTAAAEA